MAEFVGGKTCFEKAADTARPDCPKCNGTGAYQYTTIGTPKNTICDLCCTHAYGWWQLLNHYGKDNGKWCCKGGCGKTITQDEYRLAHKLETTHG